MIGRFRDGDRHLTKMHPGGSDGERDNEEQIRGGAREKGACERFVTCKIANQEDCVHPDEDQHGPS